MKTSLSLPPELPQYFYESARNRYLVRDDDGNWMPVTESSLRARLTKDGFRAERDKDEVLSEVSAAILRLQNKHHVVYAGPLAGYEVGMCQQSGQNVLVTSQRKILQPAGTEWPTLAKLFEAMLVDEMVDQRVYFYGWLKMADSTLNAVCNAGSQKSFTPGPALVIAGPKTSGKTLLALLITELLGGRRALPYRYMMGLTSFNRDLSGAEHWVIDDEASSTDLRIRRAFGYQIKNVLFGGSFSGHGKGRDAFTLYPFVRLTILMNDEPESLMILPPIDDSLEDKLMCLRTKACEMPMPANSPDERSAFWEKLMEELPAFLGWLRYSFEIPEELKYPRTGIVAFKHPVLLEAIGHLTPEDKLMTLIDDALFAENDLEDWYGTANQLTKELCSSAFSHDAKALLNWSNACGTYLGRLKRKHPARIVAVVKQDYRGWRIVAPKVRSSQQESRKEEALERLRKRLGEPEEMEE